MKCDDDSPQPSTSRSGDGNVEISHKETHIYQLNDECLLHILKYLEFSDQFNFARSCDQFQNAFVSCVRSKYKVFTRECQEFASLSTNEQRELLALIGNRILVLQIDLEDEDHTIFELIGEFCPNLSTVELSCYYAMFNINKLVDNLQMITDLQLYTSENNISDSDILVLKKLEHLEKLTLHNIVDLTGQHLNELKALQYLNLVDCHNLVPNHLIEMLRALVDLHSLKLWCCRTITLDVCRAMIQHSKKLEHLEIHLLEGFEIIAQLPSLNRLEITFDVFRHIELMLEELIDKAIQLEYLKIETTQRDIIPNIALMLGSLKNLKALQCDILLDDINDVCFCHLSKLEKLEYISLNCGDITIDVGFLQMLANCKRLSYVELYRIRYPSITIDSSFHKAIALLRSSKEERVLPVTFCSTELEPFTMHAEYTKAIEDGIIRILSHGDSLF